MAFNWSQAYETGNQVDSVGNNAEMQLLERRSQLEAQQKQQDYENQLDLLRQSAEYNNASTKQRIQMEAQLLAMRERFLPTNMTQNLLGVPNEQSQTESYGTQSQAQGGDTGSNIAGKIGAGAGAFKGVVNRATALSPLSKVATAIPQKGVLGKLAGGALTKLGGKSLGKIGGAVVGSIPGFLIGTAVGELISKLLEGNDEDKAKAEYLLNQYK